MTAPYSVVILSHERPGQLSRAIEYYRAFDCPIIVSDDSREPLSVTAGVKYFHHHRTAWTERLITVASAVGTEFCLISPDDDFALPKGVDTIVRQLTSSPALVAVQGLALEYRAFSESRFDVRLKYRNTITPYVDGTYAAPQMRNMIWRIEALTDDFFSMFWAMFRADIYRRIAGGLVDFDVSIGLADYFSSLSVSLLGQVQVANCVLFLRDVAPSRSVSREEKGFRQILSNTPDNRARTERFLDLLSQYGLPDLELIKRHSRILPDAENAREWLHFCLYRLATRSLRPYVSPAAIQRLDYKDNRLQVIMDDPIAMGDPDTRVDDIIPILRGIQNNLQPADLFHNRFPASAPRRRSVRRVLAGLHQRVRSETT